MPTLPTARRLVAGLAVLAAASAVAVHAQDESGNATVILNDGFVIQGRYFKEMEVLMDFGKPIKVAKASGFDVVDDGAKFIVFSTHARKGGKVDKEVTRPHLTMYKSRYAQGLRVLKPVARVISGPTDWNDKWQRSMKVEIEGGGWEVVDQQVVGIDPNWTLIGGTRFSTRQSHHTFELDPKVVRHLLSTHPDLKDPAGRADPQRRLNIAQFLKDVGTMDGSRRAIAWYELAKQELDKLKADAPGPWDKDATERFDKVRDEIDRAETKWAIDELEAAVGAGRYDFAQKFLAGFTPKGADPKETTRFAVLKAQVETVRPRYELTARLLADLIDREGGGGVARAFAAAGGGPAVRSAPRPTRPPETAVLVEAAEGVLAELHPDSAARLDLFYDTARIADQRRKDGLEPSQTPAKLLALAVTGWLKGKNGAEPNVDAAVRCWATRQMALNYLRDPIANNRYAALDNYLKTGRPLGPDELAQIITLLPPPFPEDLANLGTPVPKADVGGVDGIYQRNTGPLPGATNGYDYYLRLPPEYHHGRAYPVLLALTSAGVPAEQLVAQLADAADRHGYIVAAPAWAGRLKQNGYDFSGKDQPWATAVMRDLLRRFQVDPDKVFPFGFGDGGSFAVDVGMAHPDLFAGVVAMGPTLPTNITLEYWANAQKLPMYVVIGEQSGCFPSLQKLYQKWMPRGFPALMTIYKGRGHEFFRAELPRIFDWLGRKTRVRGVGGLRLNNPGFEPWQVLRPTDDRFYWVGVGPGGLKNGNAAAHWQNGRAVLPAQFQADLGRGGVVEITKVIGVRKFVIWLERDLIDWNQPLKININGRPALNYKPQKLTPDLHLMFEELNRTGDRKMLYLGKIEVDGPG